MVCEDSDMFILQDKLRPNMTHKQVYKVLNTECKQ